MDRDSSVKTVEIKKEKRETGDYVRMFLPFALLVLLIVVFSIGDPAFFTATNFMNILRQTSVLLVVSLGATWVILQGSIDLSVGSIVTVVGLSTATLLRELSGASPALAAALAVIVGLTLGLGCGVISGGLFAYGKIPSFLATLGMLSILDGLGLMLTGGSPVALENTAFQSISTGTLLGPVPNIGVLALIVYGIATWVGFRTKFGRYMFAIGGGERVTKLAGVKVDYYKFLGFVVCGLLAGLGGVLMTSRIGAGVPKMGADLLLDSIAAVVMGGTALSGGVGGPHRALLGVIVIGVLRNGMSVMGVNPYVQVSVTGVVVILAVAVTLDRSKITILK